MKRIKSAIFHAHPGFWLGMVGLLGLLAWVYHDVPNNGFHFDDHDNITEIAAMHMAELSTANLYQAATEALLPRRILANITFALDWWRGNGNPRDFLWSNLFIHAANTLVVVAFLWVLASVYRPTTQKQSLWFAAIFLGAAVWAIHPIQTQAVTYTVQRMAMMAMLFSTLSVVCYVLGRRSRGNGLPWFILALLSFIAGLISKENAAITPLLIILAEYGICRHNQPLIKSRWDWLWLLLPVVITLYCVIDIASSSGPLYQWANKAYAHRDFTLEQRLLTQPRVIMFHLSQILWPLPGRFSIEHDFLTSIGLLAPPSTLASIVTLIIWISLGCVLLVRSPKTRLWGFCLLWVPVSLAIESSFIGLEMVFEHRMYLPMVGLVGLLTLTILSTDRFQPRLSQGAVLITVLFIAFCSQATLQRIPQWRTTLTLYESALHNAPNSARLWANLGPLYLEAGDTSKAFKATETALELEPNNSLALETQGIILMDQGRLDEALNVFNKAYFLDPTKVTLINHRGELLLKQQKFELAYQAFAQAIETTPWDPTYYWNAALALEGMRECATAKTHWQRFLALSQSAADRAQVREHLQENYEASSGKCAQ